MGGAFIMMEISALETLRTRRRNLVPAEEQIAAIVRQTCHLDEDECPQDRLLAHTRRGLDRQLAGTSRRRTMSSASWPCATSLASASTNFPPCANFSRAPTCRLTAASN
jgi:hypothetical protein